VHPSKYVRGLLSLPSHILHISDSFSIYYRDASQPNLSGSLWRRQSSALQLVTDASSSRLVHYCWLNGKAFCALVTEAAQRGYHKVVLRCNIAYAWRGLGIASRLAILLAQCLSVAGELRTEWEGDSGSWPRVDQT
jgi:hypothetical protein